MAVPDKPNRLSILVLLTALVTLATATFSAYGAWLANQKIELTNEKVEEIHISINSRMDELLAATRAKARAEGVIEGEAR